jgi:hypothetical protein
MLFAGFADGHGLVFILCGTALYRTVPKKYFKCCTVQYNTIST